MNSTVLADKIDTTLLKDTYDLSVDSVRDLNQALHSKEVVAEISHWTVKKPPGLHNIAVQDQRFKQ